MGFYPLLAKEQGSTEMRKLMLQRTKPPRLDRELYDVYLATYVWSMTVSNVIGFCLLGLSINNLSTGVNSSVKTCLDVGISKLLQKNSINEMT